ncbi:helix-turn-helix transcriptional regulator [Paenibacillus odorifer]|uniref:HTH araC/xylS-type domain-containing protein n=1 Tax=Paenibacillus odorifer TaxID=189426 RepID=A0AAD0KKE2_9BACL|nr:AraC family transcriptional regulator [Paenibacillus odorifer]AWV32448.1 hypothetical protein CD191_07370 [Paenibacillus odorifer]
MPALAWLLNSFYSWSRLTIVLSRLWKVAQQNFIEKLFNKMVSEFTKQPPGYEFYLNKKIFEIVDYLNRYYDQHHSIRDIANRFYISPSYFCKTFRDSTDFTFTEYLNNVRIKEARALLINTAFKVAKIAENVGFDNMTHFGRVFKEITGLSPLKYRRTYKIESP